MNNTVIVAVICRLLAYLGSLAVPVILTLHFDNPKYLWLLPIVLFAEIVPTYEIRRKENTNPKLKENK